MHQLVRLTAAAAVAATLLAACSDADSSAPDDEPSFTAVELPEEAQPYVDALVVGLTSEPTMPIPDDQARCIAARMVQVFRFERLDAAGVEPEGWAEGNLVFDDLELSDDERLKLVDAYQQCDYDLYGAIVDSMVAGTADEAATRRCITAALSREDLRQMMAASFTSDEEVADAPELDAISEAMFACMFDEDFEQFEEIEGEL